MAGVGGRQKVQVQPEDQCSKGFLIHEGIYSFYLHIRLQVSMMKIKRIAIVGGTHGNEYTGIYLVEKLRRRLPSWDDLELNYLLANPQAARYAKRFIDHDLNRAFRLDDLLDINKSGYEFDRAKAINQELGPKGRSSTDFIIDMHTSTSNMGTTLIFCKINPALLQLAAYLKNKLQDIHVFYKPPVSEDEDQPYLDSIAPLGLAIEVGPVAHGLLRHDAIEKTEKTVMAILEFISLYNKKALTRLPESIEIYQYSKTVFFPTDEEGNILACIHESLQDGDFQPLNKGDAIFQTLSDQTIYFEEEGPVYPFFINEAAYYYQKIAFYVATKVSFEIRSSDFSKLPHKSSLSQ